MGISPVLDQVHRSHAAHVVCVAHQFAAWGVEADFAAVSSHPAAFRLSAFSFPWSSFLLARRSRAVVVYAVVILTQHRQIRRFRVPTVFVGIDVVDLAPIGRHIAVGPWADEILDHG